MLSERWRMFLTSHSPKMTCWAGMHPDLHQGSGQNVSKISSIACLQL
jgi:hypothetical protein